MVDTSATNGVLLSPFQRKRQSELREIDHSIRDATRDYLQTITTDRISELLPSADGSILSGSASTIYKKRTGHNKLTKEDLVNLFVKLGTDQEREVLSLFEQARIDFQNRLEDTKRFRLIFKEANIGRWTYYDRAKQPGLWSAEEILRILEIIEKHQA